MPRMPPGFSRRAIAEMAASGAARCSTTSIHGHKVEAVCGQVEGIDGAEVDREAIGTSLGGGAVRDFDTFHFAAELIAGLGDEGAGIAADIQEAGTLGGGAAEEVVEELAIAEAVVFGIGRAAGLEIGVLGV